MLSQNNKILIHLLLISGIGPATIFKILKQLNKVSFSLELDLTQLYSKSVNFFKYELGLSENLANLVVNGLADRSILLEELDLIHKNNIEILTILDDAYPKDLANSYLPPIVLYSKGLSISEYQKNIAVVGSRKAGIYSEKILDQFIPVLAQNGWSIISGGALGVDTMAHKTAISSNAKTIAVLGSGLLELYPDENKKLFSQMSSGLGTILSIFPLRTKPYKNNFPARNRVISGLSSGCLIVQAAKKSGALITAKFALEQGRNVFAVPGSIFDELSIGCHELILEGAKATFRVEHILEEFGEKTLSTEINLLPLQKETVAKQTDPLIDALVQASSLDELSIRLGFDITFLQDKLFELQLSGKVEQDFSGLWKKI